MMGYKKDKEDRLSYLSYKTPSRRDMSLGAEELDLRVSGFGCWQTN
jgi:hypothetical protein